MNKLSYQEFLKTKRFTVPCVGIAECPPLSLKLYPFQRDIVRWALRRGRAALFEECGLGKGWQALEWARVVSQHTNKPVLILAPLAVAQQFVREAAKLDAPVTLTRDGSLSPGINVTNYEQLAKFAPRIAELGGVVADESGILKSYDSKTRNQLIETFAATPFRLACTATPAPNDHEELGNHAEFLGIMKRVEMLSTWFEHDAGDTGTWLLKGHGAKNFWDWVAQWAVCIGSPADLGYDASGYDLPPLSVVEHSVDAGEEMARSAGLLFGYEAKGLTEQRLARKGSIAKRVEICADMVNGDHEQWLVWCGLNLESSALAAAIPDAVEICGSDSAEHKEQSILDFIDGKTRVIISKVAISGFGVNLQNCHKAAFVGISHCYSADTEILTKRGWLTFDRVTKEDDVATCALPDLAFEWQRPTEVIWSAYEGDMVSFKGQRSFDLLVTPNHRMVVRSHPERYPSRDHSWRIESAGNIHETYMRQQYCVPSIPGSYRGQRQDCVHLPQVNQRVHAKTVHIDSIPIEDFVRLAGWYVSEGHLGPPDSARAGRIVICQTDVHPDHRAEIVELLASLGLHVNDKTKDITVSNVQLASFLLEHFGRLSGHVRLPRWIKDLDRDLLVILRDTMIKGDGCHSGGIPRFYRTNSKQLADDFQEICIKTGVRAAVHRRDYGNRLGEFTWYVSLAWENINPSVYNQPDLVPYSGMVGCVSVPNGIVIVRRNGIPSVCGNSFEEWHQATRRIWRHGQLSPVESHVIYSSAEGRIVENLKRKQADFFAMRESMVLSMKETMRKELNGVVEDLDEYKPMVPMRIPAWLVSEVA